MKRVVILLAVLLLAGRALAHGIGTPQQIDAAAGPYLVSVWTDPDPLRVNETHVTVAVMDPATREPLVRDVRVMVRLKSAIDETVVRRVSALPDNTTIKVLYAAVFNNLPHPGRWLGTVSVSGPAGAGDDVHFEIEVLGPRPVNWGLIGGLALGVVTIAWLAWTWRQKPEAVERPPQRTKSGLADHEQGDGDER